VEEEPACEEVEEEPACEEVEEEQAGKQALVPNAASQETGQEPKEPEAEASGPSGAGSAVAAVASEGQEEDRRPSCAGPRLLPNAPARLALPNALQLARRPCPKPSRAHPKPSGAPPKPSGPLGPRPAGPELSGPRPRPPGPSRSRSPHRSPVIPPPPQLMPRPPAHPPPLRRPSLEQVRSWIARIDRDHAALWARVRLQLTYLGHLAAQPEQPQ
jgi:hypothetical protein